MIKINYNILFTIIIFLYIITLTFSNNIILNRSALFICIFILIKWIYNYRKCTLSYIECKVRNVEKEKGYIYNYCNYFGDLIYNDYISMIFLLLVFLLFINLIKVINNIFKK